MRRLSILGAALGLIAVSAAAQDAAFLAPHEAIYELRRADPRDPSVQDAYGEMRIRRTMTCVSVAERQSLRVVKVQRGQPSAIAQSADAYESLDESVFRISVAFDQGGATAGRTILAAERLGDEVTLTQDGRAAAALPPDTRFPSGWLAAVLRAAQGGAATVEGLLFDGAAPDALRAQVLIASRRLYDGRHAGAPLPSPEIWPIRTAYYNRDSAAARPVLTTEAEYTSEGVAVSFLLPLSPAPMRARLTSLIYLDRPAC